MAQLVFNHGKLAFTINNCFFMYVVTKKGDMKIIQIDIYGHGGSPIIKQ
jgi:hypothetical protein